MLKIRAATQSDVPQIENCVHAAYAHYIERIGSPPGPILDDYSEMVAKHAVFVIEVGPEIAGILVLIEFSDHFLLDNVAVQPQFQGRGIGKQLMQQAERVALERGFQEIQLYTHEMMVENVAIYGRIGYIEFDRRTEKGFERIYMRKALE